MAMNAEKTINWWMENLLRPVLVAAMLVCLVAPLTRLLEFLFLGWDGTYFLVFSFFAGLEGILSERILQKQHITGWGYLGSRAAEVLVLVILMKLASYVNLGLDQLWADALRWQTDPGSFFDGLLVYMSLLFLPMWLGALYVGRTLRELDVNGKKSEPPKDKTSIQYYLWLISPKPAHSRQEELERLAGFFVWGGAALLLVSAAIHQFVFSVQTLVLPILLYFALGVALLSQGHFSVLHARWAMERVPIQRGMARRWLLWGLVFLVGVASIALLLPTSYAAGPIRALLSLFGYIFGFVFQLLYFIFSLVIYLFALLVSTIFPSMREPTRPTPPGIPAAPPGQMASSGAGGLLEMILTALFWVLILSIVGYALYRFVRDRLGPWAESEQVEGTWWGRFLGWLQSLWQWIQNWRRGVQAQLRRRLMPREREGAGSLSPFRFVSLRRLSPRQLVQYFYLSTERRAAQAGQPRGSAQTPYEYQAELDRRFPEIEPDLDGLTEAFVEARYSRQPVQEEEAAAVKTLWQRIKAALVRRRRGA
jgi:hypothetical protein